MNRAITFVAVLTVVLIIHSFGCKTNTGLEPVNEPSGFSGVIRFKNWPPPDSVQELRLVAFKQVPRDSTIILFEYALGRAAVYPAVGTTGFPKFVDSIRYVFTTSGTTLVTERYDYIVVAWRYGPNFLVDWRPAGLYVTEPNTFNPAFLRVLLHKVHQNIDITCDFRNPPPRPWR